METSVQSPSASDTAQYQHLNSNCVQTAVFDKFPFQSNRIHQFQNFSLEFQNTQQISDEILTKNQLPDSKTKSKNFYGLKCEKWDEIFRNSECSLSTEINMNLTKEFPEFQVDMQVILSDIFEVESTTFENNECTEQIKKLIPSNDSYDWNSNSTTNSDLLSSTSSSLSPRNSNFNRMRSSLSENLELYKILNENLRMNVDDNLDATATDDTEKFTMNLQNSVLSKKNLKLHKAANSCKDAVGKNLTVAAKPNLNERQKFFSTVMRLNKSDMGLYGFCPEIDPLYVVICNICNKCIKPQALEKHLLNRHQLNSNVCKNLEKFDTKLISSQINQFKPNLQLENEIVEDVSKKVLISGECSNTKIEKTSKIIEETNDEDDDIIISKLTAESNYLSNAIILKSTLDTKLLQDNTKSTSNFNIQQLPQETSLSEIQPIIEFTSNATTSNPNKFKDSITTKEAPESEKIVIASDQTSINSSNIKTTIENIPLETSSPSSVAHYLTNNNMKIFQFATPNDPKLPITPKQRKILPIKQRFYDPNKHCGVLTSDLNLSEADRTLKPCTRSLTCKSHALSLRRSVLGRAKSFDNLLNEHRTNKEKIIEEKSTTKNVTAKRKPSATDLYTTTNPTLNLVENFTLVETPVNVESLKIPVNSKHISKTKLDKPKLNSNLKKFKIATQTQNLISSDNNNNSNLPNLDLILQKDVNDIQGNSAKYKRLKDYMLLKVSQNRNNAKIQLQRKFSTKTKFNSKQNKLIDHNDSKANSISHLIGFLSNGRENVIVDGTKFNSNNNQELIVNYNSDDKKTLECKNTDFITNTTHNEFELLKLEKVKYQQSAFDKINSQQYEFNSDQIDGKLQECVNLQEVEPVKYEIEKLASIQTKPIQQQHMENYSQPNYNTNANKFASNQNFLGKLFSGSSQISNPPVNNCYTTTQIITNDAESINPNYQYLITLQNHLQFQNSNYVPPHSENPVVLRQPAISNQNSEPVRSSIILEQQQQPLQPIPSIQPLQPLQPIQPLQPLPQINSYAYLTPTSTIAEKLENRKIINLSNEFDFQSKPNKNLINELGLIDIDVIPNPNVNRNPNSGFPHQQPNPMFCDALKYSNYEYDGKYEYDDGVRVIAYNSYPKPIKMNNFNLMKMKNSPYSILFRKSALQLRKLNLAMLNGINLSHCTNSQQQISIGKRLTKNSTQNSSVAQNFSQQQYLQHMQQQKRQQSFQPTEQTTATKLLQGIANSNISKQQTRQQKSQLNSVQNNSIKNVANNLSRYPIAQQQQPHNQNKLNKRSIIMNKILLKELITCSKNSKLTSTSKFQNKKFDKNRIKINSKLLIYLKANCEPVSNVVHNSELIDNSDFQILEKQHSDIDINFESNMNFNRYDAHIKHEAIEILPSTKRTKYCNNHNLVKNVGIKLNCNTKLNNLIDYTGHGTKIVIPLETNHVQQQTQQQQQSFHPNNSNLNSINFMANLNRQSLLNITNNQRQQQQQQQQLLPHTQHPQA